MKNLGCGAFLGLQNSSNTAFEVSSIGQRVKRVFSQNSFGDVASDSSSLMSITDKDSEESVSEDEEPGSPVFSPSATAPLEFTDGDDLCFSKGQTNYFH